MSRRAWLVVLVGAVLFPGIALAQLDPATVPEAKRTRSMRWCRMSSTRS